MKQLLITIAAVLLVGCGESQQSAPTKEAKPVDTVTEVSAQQPSPFKSQPAKPVAEAKAPNISIVDDAYDGNIEAVKQHLAAGTDVNAKNEGMTPLHWVAYKGNSNIIELLIAKGADVNAKDVAGFSPLHHAETHKWPDC